MPKPQDITEEMIEKWNELLESNEVTSSLLEMPGARDAFLAGIWLFEQLTARNCPQEFIVQIQFAGGKLSYGNEDPWEVHQKLLNAYDSNQLVFETNPNTTLN